MQVLEHRVPLMWQTHPANKHQCFLILGQNVPCFIVDVENENKDTIDEAKAGAEGKDPSHDKLKVTGPQEGEVAAGIAPKVSNKHDDPDYNKVTVLNINNMPPKITEEEVMKFLKEEISEQLEVENFTIMRPGRHQDRAGTKVSIHSGLQGDTIRKICQKFHGNEQKQGVKRQVPCHRYWPHYGDEKRNMHFK